MNHVFRTFRILFAATVLAGFALPAVAADKLFLVAAKTYSVSGTTVTSIGSVIPQGSTTILLLEYQNQSPNGANSVIKSIKAWIPTDVKWAFAASKSLNVSSQNPSVSCDAPPASYANNAPATLGLGGDPTSNSPSYTQNSITGVKPTGKFCLYLAVTSNGDASCQATQWGFEANTGNSFTGGVNFADYNLNLLGQTQLYTLTNTQDGCTGILGCGVPSGNNQGGTFGSKVNNNPPLAFIGSPDWGLERAKKNKDGALCTVPVPYQFNFSTITNNLQTAEFVVPDTKGEGVAVEYVLLWSPIPTASMPTASSGLPYPRLQLGWLKDGNGWILRPALACKDDDLEQVDGSPLPTIPFVAPFNNGCTSATDLSGCTQPLGYRPGDTAKMCVAQEGSTSVGGSPPATQLWHKVIDYGDGGNQLSY